MLIKGKLLGLMVMVIVFAIMSSCRLFPSNPTDVVVREDQDREWRIYDDKNNNRGVWMVKEGKRITWVANGSDMRFSFPLDMDSHFLVPEGLFAETDSVNTGPENELRRIQDVAEGDSLSLRVNTKKKAVINYSVVDYDIYVFEAEKYVIGNSPPYIIIQRTY